MKRIVLFIIIALSFRGVYSESLNDLIVKMPAHPRIIFTKGGEAKIKKTIKNDKLWLGVHDAIINKSNEYLTIPVSERVMDGRRLLPVSRENLSKILFLGYSYRITGDNRYSRRAIDEMIAISNFSDWNPSHFLDVAEMTTAMAVGYDWLYNKMTESERETISNAIIEHGLKPSLKYNHWLRVKNNWNQVCNAGMTFGALAVYPKEAELCREIVARSLESVKIPMEQYAPNGAYPEGAGYWNYGTSYNAMLISLLESALGNDFGLSDAQGFLDSGLYSQVAILPSLSQFNYGDNKPEALFTPAQFWFYSKLKDTSLYYYQTKLLDRMFDKEVSRFLPLSIIWGAQSGAKLAKAQEPARLDYKGDGETPVVFLRSSWSDPNGIFIGFKGGNPSTSHSHLDIGTFMMCADGVDWAIDLGQEDYKLLEDYGIRLWDKQRWDVYRYNSVNHNVITVNDKMQNSRGTAVISGYNCENPHKLMSASSNLTELYNDLLKNIDRSISLVDKSYVVVEDSFETFNQYTKIRWNMVSRAEKIVPIERNVAKLICGDKSLYMVVESDIDVDFSQKSTTSANLYDSPNPNSSQVGFEAIVPRAQKNKFKVYLIPSGIDYKEVLKK